MIRLICAGLMLTAAATALAQDPPRPPRVGLVLGGGGARGGAHLGVLEVLEEMRVPVACIAGTSMGALVGGAYASGVAPKEIGERVGETDWTTMFDDFAGRERRFGLTGAQIAKGPQQSTESTAA